MMMCWVGMARALRRVGGYLAVECQQCLDSDLVGRLYSSEEVQGAGCPGGRYTNSRRHHGGRQSKE